MGITVTNTLGEIQHQELITADDMRELGLLLRERIVRRTMSGTDAAGRPFTPYSPRYAAAKQKALGGASTVNLQVSGAMLNDLVLVEVSGWPHPRVVIGFSK